MRFIGSVCELVVIYLVSLAWMCEGEGGEDIYSCDVFSPANFNISIDSNIKFRVRPRYIGQSGKWVAVRWYNVGSPSDGDWIGVYPSSLNDTYPISPANYSPIKFQFASVSSSHTTYGRGSLAMKLVNIHTPLVIGFFRGGLENPTLIAYSKTIYFKNSVEPTQLHLSLTGNENEVMVTWTSSAMFRPIVCWGPASGYYTHVNISVSTSYNSSDMCSSPATDFGYTFPGIIHSTTMSSLQPGQQYYYIVGDNCNWSHEYSFTAPPSSNQSFNFVTYGESGCAEVDGSHHIYEHQASLNVTKSVYNQIEDIDLILHLGGLSFAKGYSSVWDTFFDQIEPIASVVPYMVAVGVAEVGQNVTNSTCSNSTDCGGECGVPFGKRFNMPWKSTNGDSPWYDFDFGSAHFVVMSTEHDFTWGTFQYQFIVSSLQSVNRTLTPWIILSGHRPMYTVSSQDLKEQNITDTLQANLEPVFRAYQVDLALWSYHHSYQRTCPVYRGNCMDDSDDWGTVHIMVGTGGAQLEQNSTDTPGWIKYMDTQNHGYVKISVAYDALSIEFISTDKNTMLDTLEMTKSDHSSYYYYDSYLLQELEDDPSDYVHHDVV